MHLLWKSLNDRLLPRFVKSVNLSNCGVIIFPLQKNNNINLQI